MDAQGFLAATNKNRFLVGLVVFMMSPAYSQERPFWEVGLGFAGLNFPDYIGSDNRNNLVLPFPYVVYRGERLQIERDSVAGQLFESERLRLELSLSGSIPVDSDNNKDRRGMPDLDPIVETGPSLTYELYRTLANNGSLILELPVRGAIASDFKKIHPVGWISNPNIKYQAQYRSEDGLWTFDISLGPLFGNRRYHDYFYGVDRPFATEARPDFDASGGFGGWRLALGLSGRSGNLWYGAFLRYTDLTDAIFAASPLVKMNHSIIGGFAIAWIVARSDTGTGRMR